MTTCYPPRAVAQSQPVVNRRAAPARHPSTDADAAA